MTAAFLLAAIVVAAWIATLATAEPKPVPLRIERDDG